MSPEDRIYESTVAALRELSLERLIEEQKGLRDNIEEALAFTNFVFEQVIAEKRQQRTMN